LPGEKGRGRRAGEEGQGRQMRRGVGRGAGSRQWRGPQEVVVSSKGAQRLRIHAHTPCKHSLTPLNPSTPHTSHLTPHPSPLTPHTSPLTSHPSHLTPHPSPLSLSHMPHFLPAPLPSCRRGVGRGSAGRLSAASGHGRYVDSRGQDMARIVHIRSHWREGQPHRSTTKPNR